VERLILTRCKTVLSIKFCGLLKEAVELKESLILLKMTKVYRVGVEKKNK